jgi:hypothetical protein
VAGWWGGRVRQFRRYVGGRIPDAERRDLAAWLTPAQQSLFDGMHRADQRHGLDVVAALRAEGHAEPDLLLAGLFHDAAKGPDVGLWPRVCWALGDHYGAWIVRATRPLPGFDVAFDRLRDHAEASAVLAAQAGCSAITADLIRHQSQPVDAQAGEALRLADEAN